MCIICVTEWCLFCWPITNVLSNQKNVVQHWTCAIYATSKSVIIWPRSKLVCAITCLYRYKVYEIRITFTFGCHRRRWVLSPVIVSVHLSVRLSVRPSVSLSIHLSVCLSVPNDVPALTIYGFQLSAKNLVGWCTAPWSRMAMLGQFCVFYGTLKFCMIGFLTRSEGQRYCSNSLRISAIGLNCGGMMHSDMKQIAI